ncbi:hypothetical protein [Streptomyces sp. NPDC060035]|uniref:hypothetical protein n=1 Tax=Streptomyces sp. NPDC060035 TaxID=3347044 RepID=UPI003686D5FB
MDSGNGTDVEIPVMTDEEYLGEPVPDPGRSACGTRVRTARDRSGLHEGPGTRHNVLPSPPFTTTAWRTAASRAEIALLRYLDRWRST